LDDINKEILKLHLNDNLTPQEISKKLVFSQQTKEKLRDKNEDEQQKYLLSTKSLNRIEKYLTMLYLDKSNNCKLKDILDERVFTPEHIQKLLCVLINEGFNYCNNKKESVSSLYIRLERQGWTKDEIYKKLLCKGYTEEEISKELYINLEHDSSEEEKMICNGY
jgi:hypothetical protein